MNKFNPETKPLPHSLNHSVPLPHSLISAFLLRRRRSLAQIATHSLPLSLTLISASLPRSRRNSLSASSPSSSFGTLSVLVLLLLCQFLFFVQFFKEIKFIFLTKTIIKREREKKSNLCFLCIIVC